jgi:hypothetical protein
MEIAKAEVEAVYQAHEEAQEELIQMNDLRLASSHVGLADPIFA